MCIKGFEGRRQSKNIEESALTIFVRKILCGMYQVSQGEANRVSNIFLTLSSKFLKGEFNTYTENEDGQGKSSQINSIML